MRPSILHRLPSFILVSLSLAGIAAAEVPDFSRDILPLLSDNCFACHGPDESHRKAKLRLDLRDTALAGTKGRPAIIAGVVTKGTLLERITADDPDELMPPADSHRDRLKPQQVDLLTRWIAAGAPWGRYWSFVPPVRPALPQITGTANPIDAFIRARLAQENLAPAEPAATSAQVRRLSFTLTGLPPTSEDVATVTTRTDAVAYAQLVDRLLASPAFGERMAMWWLDVARYADTDGFQADDTRTNWPWRDWVVEAFNRNVPLDRFITLQMAGDLLPNATAEDQLATCFHRNHMTNGEGGRDPEESRIDYVIDRVNTTGTAFLGLTLGCAQCHSHKFDPVSQRDYYALTAFFNSIDEDGKAGKAAKPYLAYESATVPRAVAEAKALVDQRTPAEASAKREAQAPFSRWLSQQAAEVRHGHQSWTVLHPTLLESSEGTTFAVESDGTVMTGGPLPNQDDYRVVGHVALPRITGLRLEILPHPSFTNGSYARGKNGFFILTDLKVQVRRSGSSQVRDVALASAVADVTDEADAKKFGGYGAIKDILDDDPRNGWSTRKHDLHQPRTAVVALADPLVLADDEQIVVELRQRSTLGDADIGRFRVAFTDERGPAVKEVVVTPLEALAVTADRSKPEQALRDRLFAQFLTDYSPYITAKDAVDRARRQLDEVTKAKKVDVMVLAERKELRETHVLVRGVWDRKGERVERGVPEAISPWPTDAPRDRLGLARWLVERSNPLTARVMVNHLWQLCFGAGLVRTVDDFGLQGERPSHPELLDWLAVDLMENGWDLKRLLRLIVTSDTFRQDSAVSAALLARDPQNRLLARGARFRLPSWMLRDAALAAGGLLNPEIGGPPVKPYQPDGMWEELFMGRFRYEASEGLAQYRCTFYAFWRRSIVPTFLF
ncbi:MAG TPA: PSD1 and planctomycete cytochrome C domain-containing protein, partial [Planctomycetota bacterium]|nr:PSD1 and planctomycete cytochrome C domain-containing protein [Planctomycetota bacterium]